MAIQFEQSKSVGFWLRRIWILGALVPVLALIGWLINNPYLKGWGAGLTAMNPFTALCFLIGFAALLLVYGNEKQSGQARLVGGLLAVAALTRIGCYFAGWEWGLDTWLFASKIDLEAIPNRMAPNTALAFVCVGLAIALIDRPARGSAHPSDFLAIIAGSFGLITIVGYAFQTAMMTRVTTHIPMAVSTGTLFLLISAVILRARPERGMFAVAHRSRTAGIILSRLLWVFIPVPLVFAFIEARAVQADLVTRELGAALFVLFLLGVQTYASLRTACYVAKVDELRGKAEADLRQSREEARLARLEADHQAEMLDRLAKAAEFRDDDTGLHTRRVGDLSADIARELGLPSEEVELIRRAAPLHDIGKIGISDLILLKPGKLTEEEFEMMKQHTLIGSQILTEGRSEMVQVAATIARTHHEKWNGTGYPHGLRGDEIPLSGRIVAVADVFDALTNERPYKSAWPIQKALDEIQKGAGQHFDPAVVDAFLKVVPFEPEVRQAA